MRAAIAVRVAIAGERIAAPAAAGPPGVRVVPGAQVVPGVRVAVRGPVAMPAVAEPAAGSAVLVRPEAPAVRPEAVRPEAAGARRHPAAAAGPHVVDRPHEPVPGARTVAAHLDVRGSVAAAASGSSPTRVQLPARGPDRQGRTRRAPAQVEWRRRGPAPAAAALPGVAAAQVPGGWSGVPGGWPGVPVAGSARRVRTVCRASGSMVRWRAGPAATAVPSKGRARRRRSQSPLMRGKQACSGRGCQREC